MHAATVHRDDQREARDNQIAAKLERIHAPRDGRKTDAVIALLRRQCGATVAELREATGSTNHGSLISDLRTRRFLTVIREGDRYYIRENTL